MLDPASIKAARIVLELTQRQFADELGTTQQRISEWECGLTPKNAWQRLLAIYLRDKGVALKDKESPPSDG